MKKVFGILFTICLWLFSCSKKADNTDHKSELSNYHFNGKIKSVKSELFNLIIEKDTFKIGEKINSLAFDRNSLLEFNELGNLTSVKEFLYNGKVIKEDIYTYDKNDLLIKRKEIDNYGKGSFLDFEFKYDGYYVDSSLPYNVNQDNKLFAYPCVNTLAIGDVLGEFGGSGSEQFDNVIGEGVAAAILPNGNWGGSLSHFETGKGYWFMRAVPEIFDLYWSCEENISRVEEQAVVIEVPEEIRFAQSSEQAFYFIEELDINGEPIYITGDQWIVSYCNDNVVGSRQWLGEIVDVPAMGYNGSDFTEGFCEFNEKLS